MKHIVVQNLSKSFADTAVLRGVSFDVSRGDAVALIGANGSGKSTLLRSCVRLIEPNGGSLLVNGVDITMLRGKALRKFRSSVGFVFQKHQLVPRLSALSNVIHGSLGKHYSPLHWYQCLAPSAVRMQGLDCLRQVGMDRFAGKRVDQLSGGQAQRVAIARALMQEPEILLADEPTASLDPVAGKEVMELMHSLTSEKGITLVFTCHDMELACEYSHRIIGLKDGIIQLDSPTAQQSPDTLRGFFDFGQRAQQAANEG